MKSITTLVADIYRLFEERPEISKEQADKFGEGLAKIIASRLGRDARVPALSMSMLGTLCLRKLWYQINKPDAAEPLDGQTRLKFLYGDLLEYLLLFLAELAGHSVTGQQDELSIDGVLGHRDAIIDGVLVDVKSASPAGFKKFELHWMEHEDPFGYLDQINAYLFASKDDPLLVDKRNAAFLAIEKSLGKIVLDVYPANGTDYHKKVETIRAVLAQSEPPERYYPEVEEQRVSVKGGEKHQVPTGNLMLGVECSYCAFKDECWGHLDVKLSPGRAPKFFTKVVKPWKSMAVIEAQGFDDPVSDE